jgi:parallel beta-helix repeat protein
MPIINALDFGVDPLGSIDSTNGLQGALGSVTAGSQLVIPAGLYKVSEQLTLQDVSDVTITAEAATLLLVDQDEIDPGAASVFCIDSCAGIDVTGLKIDGTGSEYGYNGLRIKDSSDVNLERIKVIHMKWAGITVFDTIPCSSANVSMTACHSYGCRFGISTNGVRTRIATSYVGGPGLGTNEGHYDGIMVLSQAKLTTIIGNAIVGCGAAGVYTQDCENLTVVGNTVQGCLGRGIEIDGDQGLAKGATIDGNTVSDCWGGINLVNARDVAVTGNRVYNNSETAASCIAVNFGSSGVSVVGNHCRTSHETHPAVYAHESVSKVVIAHNRVHGINKYQVPEQIPISIS